jgi:CrcB protein
MKKVLFVGVGGMLGAVLRYSVKENISFISGLPGSIPWGTLIANISGSFILAVFMTLTLTKLKIPETVKLAVATGFIGAYTTFSTLCKETVNLVSNGFWQNAFIYAAISVFLGLSSAYLGVYLTERLIKKFN